MKRGERFKICSAQWLAFEIVQCRRVGGSLIPYTTSEIEIVSVKFGVITVSYIKTSSIIPPTASVF